MGEIGREEESGPALLGNVNAHLLRRESVYTLWVDWSEYSESPSRVCVRSQSGPVPSWATLATASPHPPGVPDRPPAQAARGRARRLRVHEKWRTRPSCQGQPSRRGEAGAKGHAGVARTPGDKGPVAAAGAGRRPPPPVGAGCSLPTVRPRRAVSFRSLPTLGGPAGLAGAAPGAARRDRGRCGSWIGGAGDGPADDEQVRSRPERRFRGRDPRLVVRPRRRWPHSRRDQHDVVADFSTQRSDLVRRAHSPRAPDSTAIVASRRAASLTGPATPIRLRSASLSEVST